MIEISKELSKHWNILLTEEDIADAYKNSNRHESDCFVLATSFYTEVQLNISNLQLIDGVLYADINEVEGLPMNIVKVDVEGGHLIAYYREGIGQMSRIDLGSVVGPKGDAGAMPNISVGEVVTGAPGSNANVSITGTEEDPVLNFTIPRGAIGEVSEAELSKKLNEKADVISGTVSGDIVTFDGTGGDLFSCVANIEPIQSGTGDPSPTNVRPISGRTGLTVTHANKNLAPNMAGQGSSTSNGITFTYNDDGSVTLNGTATGNAFIRAVDGISANIYLPKGTYKKPALQNGNVGLYVQYRKSASNWVTVSGGGTSSQTFVIDEDYPLIIRVGVISGTTVDNLRFEPYVYPESISDTTWVSPVKTNYPVTWEMEAGTVYGGTLDVVSGVLTVDKYFLTCADTITPNVGAYTYEMNPNRWQIALQDNYMPSNEKMGESISDRFAYYAGGISQWLDGTFRLSSIQSNGYRLLQFKWDGQPTTVEDLKALLAENPIHFVIPLATPHTYQLTPTEVRTILGDNNIYTDAGTIIAEYPADTEKYIDNSITNVKRLIAGIETDYIATKNYAVGDFLVVKNEFLKVVSAIANGEGIVVGQNVSSTTVAEQLILLFNS